jgi:hypothetical protein
VSEEPSPVQCRILARAAHVHAAVHVPDASSRSWQPSAGFLKGGTHIGVVGNGLVVWFCPRSRDRHGS